MRSLLLLALIGLGVSVFSIAIHPVSAIGLVYVSPAQQGPFQSGTTVTYQVKVQNMDPFNGWDIKVAVDFNKNALNLTSLTITPNLFVVNYSQPVTEFVNCVNAGVGIPFNAPGNIGCGAFDGPGIAHSAGVISARPPMTTPVNGTLFTMSYMASTGILTSVRITDALIANGTGSPVPNQAIGGIYGVAKLPLVNFVWSPALPIPGQLVTFNASSTTDLNPGATITNYEWTFGDGSAPVTSTTNFTTHSFSFESSKGGFNVVLTVTDNLGISNSGAKSVVVMAITPPSFSLHKQHHLSLAEDHATQTWHGSILNLGSTTIVVLIEIAGHSLTNPSLTFDITCDATTCVNTLGTPATTSGLTPITIAAGGAATFNAAQSIPGNFQSNKLCYTGTLFFGPSATGPITPGPSQSGCFSVVP